MSEGVWCSVAPGSSDTVPRIESDILQKDRDFALGCIRRNIRGEQLGAECFPSRINLDPNVDHPDKVTATRHLFQGGYWFVSEETADVLRSFDMGNGALYPVEFLERDRKTPVEGKYFCLNFGNTKQTFQPEKSNGVGQIAGMEGYGQLYPIAKDEDVAVSADALSGPDIWIEPRLIVSFFVSERLAAGLRAAGVDKAFKLRRCRIS